MSTRNPEHIAEFHPIGVDQNLEPATQQGIFRDWAFPFRLAGFRVLVRLRFRDELIGQGQREIRPVIKGAVIDEIQDIHPFDVRVLVCDQSANTRCHFRRYRVSLQWCHPHQ